MTDHDALLAGIVSDPLEETRWLVLADWLEENDDPRRAEFLRLHRRMLATCCAPDAHPERAAWQARMTELLVAGVRPCVPQETLMLPGDVPITFSFIPPGAFLMGSNLGIRDVNSVRRVEVPRGFFLGVYPVTQEQWSAVTGTDPSRLKGARRPVESVSRVDALAFCARLTALTGHRIELPSEAEWESACRAGTTTEFPFGDSINTDLVNYNGACAWNDLPKGVNRRTTTDVGSFPANPWGLFDLLGNVWEWCADPYDGRTGYGVARGGCYGSDPNECRAAPRGGFIPEAHNPYCGLRVLSRPD
jgi:uncharacterized protein (TIGR02996 family)